MPALPDDHGLRPAEEAVGRGVYRHACPNCGGPICEARLRRGLPCERCLPDARGLGPEEALEALRRAGRLGEGLARLAELEGEARGLLSFFEEAVGSPAWGAQRTWARRLVRGDSFSIIAPTGVGKTTFGLAAALYLACRRGERSYLVFPTTTLVVQAARRLEEMAGRTGCQARVLAIHSRMGVRARREAMERFRGGDYDVLVSTAAFMRKHAGELGRAGFRLVFADDVDAVLRSARSVDALLMAAGFTEEDVEAAGEVLRLQRQAAALRARLQRVRAREERLAAEERRLEWILRVTRSRERRREAEERLREVRRELEVLRRDRRELEERLARIEESLSKLEERISRARRRAATVIVSSATGRPRGARVRLFRVLLGFEAGGRAAAGLRNVVDAYTRPRDGVYEEAVRITRELGDGVLVFVPIDHGVEGAERLAAMLREAGLEAEAYHAKKPLSILDRFAAGEIAVLVGVANYYGTLVRGLDLPARVKYAVFAGVPRHKFPADIGDPHPARLIRLMTVIASLDHPVAEEARRHLAGLRRVLRRLSPAALQAVAERVAEGEAGPPGSAARVVAEAYHFLRRALEDEEVWRLLSEKTDVGVVVEGGRRYILVPDPATYIQASGRTSRLYAGGLTKGLSVVVVDDERVFRGLVERTRWMADVDWRPLEEVDLERLKEEIEEERRRVREILSGRAAPGRDLVKTALLVVESPNKARTIAGFFGQPSVRILPGGFRAYEVATGEYILTIAASGGHVYDLAVDVDVEGADVPPSLSRYEPEDYFGVLVAGDGGAGRSYVPVYTSIKRCLDCGFQFTRETGRCPRCGSRRIRDSRSVVEDLRRLAWEVDLVLIGTDPDTEGEKIGWDLAMLLKPYSRAIARLEFHEVTRRAIARALEALRDFDDRLVDAQIVRRVEDRWIGFTLSPLLWCDFWPHFYCPLIREVSAASLSLERARPVIRTTDEDKCARERYYYNLSAGRVQTPTLGWVVERTREAKRKVYRVVLEVDGATIAFREDELEGPEAEKAEALRALRAAARRGEPVDVQVRVVDYRWEARPPPPPYTTDTLLADANRLLGLGAPEAMRLAQDLFEWGLITYHRTDSVRVSDQGMEVARLWLEQKFGPDARELYKPRRWGEGGAHEAIRPTRPVDADALRLLVEEGALELAGELTPRHLRLYDMIFRRFMASQMREAEVAVATITVTLAPHEASVVLRDRLVGEGEGLRRGYRILWPYPRVEEGLRSLVEKAVRRAEEEGAPVGEAAVWAAARVREMRKVSWKPLYSQGEIVQLMKERGIGRPSTYAKIVETLLRRHYISVQRANGREIVVATKRGMAVYDYLTRHLRDASEDFYGPLARYLRRVPDLVSEERTRKLEEAMTAIEEGVRDRPGVLDEIHGEIEGLARVVKYAMEGRGLPEGWSGVEALEDLAECLSRAQVTGGEGVGRKG